MNIESYIDVLSPYFYNFGSHSLPLIKLSETNGSASCGVSSLDHDTRPPYSAPGPVHLYCPKNTVLQNKNNSKRELHTILSLN